LFAKDFIYVFLTFLLGDPIMGGKLAIPLFRPLESLFKEASLISAPCSTCANKHVSYRTLAGLKKFQKNTTIHFLN